VFVTHNHSDHFNANVFKWQKGRTNIDYVVSFDVRTRQRAIRMNPYEHVDVDGLSIDTYGSTDAGVSFLVVADGLHIFHAGDLNLWHWIDESSEDEVKWAKRAFLKEMEYLKGQRMDIAFFPVDPRMGRGHDAGAAHFVRAMHPGMMVPMHFGNKIKVAKTFADKMAQSGYLVWAPQFRGDYCDFDPNNM
jgi:L-ascorbate metabolism protein UlaG (beta-lactamase superfamily)